jgi:peroxiredoxin/predicted 2-oxoglutarate/Fe(II)-dependent dioxygenase YbiX
MPTFGEAVPSFTLPTTDRPSFLFDSIAGRPVVLSFFGSAGQPDSWAVLQEFHRRTDRFNDRQCTFFGVSDDPEDVAQKRIRSSIPGYRYFLDFDLEITKLLGLNRGEGGSLARYSLVLDERHRLFAAIPFGDDPQTHVQKVMMAVSAIPPVNPDVVAQVPAPVLVVPRIFEVSLCHRLIEYYKTLGGKESGFMREKDGKTVAVYDDSYKKRRDQTIDDEDLRRACMGRLHDRLVPQIEKAFQFKATRVERYIVARYDGSSGGYFRPHRDNTTKGTAHRKFAVSINLNFGEFEGGQLRFPEYGQQRYAPPTGGAVVFSCSILHEATPVTSGERFCFLPFLYDDKSAEIRAQNLQYLESENPG